MNQSLLPPPARFPAPILLAAALLALGAIPPASAAGETTVFKLDEFGPNQTSYTLDLWPCAMGLSIAFVLPPEAIVFDNASLAAHVSLNGSGSGWLTVQIGSDPTPDANISVDANASVYTVPLPAAAINAVLRAEGVAGGREVHIPLAFSYCGNTANLTFTFDTLAAWYRLGSLDEVSNQDTRHLGPLVVATCGPVATEHFSLPADARVLYGWVALDFDGVNSTALQTALDVHAGATVVNSTNLTGFPRPFSIDLDAAAINGHLLNQSPVGGAVGLDLALSICPTLGVAIVPYAEISVTYIRTALNLSNNGTGGGTGNSTGPAMPSIVGVTVDGALLRTVDSGTPFVIGVAADGTLNGSVQFSWFVDGALVGHGPTLPAFAFTPGDHNITVRASDGSSVQTYSMTITAVARPPPGPFVNPFLIVGLAGAALIGIAVARTDAGRYLLLASLGSVFARLKKASLLDHFVRGTLYQIIRENPGVHFAELRRRAEIANGVASHHLRMLEKGGYIKVVIDGTKTKFYLTERPLEAEVYGISDTEKAILEAVTGSPGIGQHELAGRVNRSPSAVSRAVSRLATMGYITTTHEGARVLLFPRPGNEVIDPLTPAWPDEGA